MSKPRIDELSTDEFESRLRAVDDAMSDDFTALVGSAGLDPRRDLRFFDFAGANFDRQALRGYDFTGCDLGGATFAGAEIEGAIFDCATFDPAALVRAADYLAFLRTDLARKPAKRHRANPSRLRDLAVFREAPFAPEMVVIPAGEFMMGSDLGDAELEEDDKASDDEIVPGQGKRLMRIPRRFAMGRFPVTFEEFVLAGAELTINEKNQPERRGRSHAAWWVSTNFERPLDLPAYDRRWEVFSSSTKLAPAVGQRLYEAAKSPASSIKQEFVNHLWGRDLSKFHPLEIIETDARKEMIAASRTPTEVFWAEIRSVEGVLPVGDILAKEAFLLYTNWMETRGHKPMANNKFGMSVPKEWKQDSEGKPHMGGERKKQRIYRVPDFGQPTANRDSTDGISENDLPYMPVSAYSTPQVPSVGRDAVGMPSVGTNQPTAPQTPTGVADPNNAVGAVGRNQKSEGREKKVDVSQSDPTIGIQPTAPTANQPPKGSMISGFPVAHHQTYIDAEARVHKWLIENPSDTYVSEDYLRMLIELDLDVHRPNGVQ